MTPFFHNISHTNNFLSWLYDNINMKISQIMTIKCPFNVYNNYYDIMKLIKNNWRKYGKEISRLIKGNKIIK